MPEKNATVWILSGLSVCTVSENEYSTHWLVSFCIF